MNFDQYRRGDTNYQGYTGHISEHAAQADFSGLANAGNTLNNIATQGAAEVIKQKQKAKEDQDKFDRQQALRTFSEFQLQDAERSQSFKQNYTGDPTKFAESDLKNQGDLIASLNTEPLTPGAQEHLDQLMIQNKIKSQAESFSYQALLKGAKAKENVAIGSRNFINDTRLNPFTNFWGNQKKLDDLVESMKGLVPEADLHEYKTSLHDENAVAMIRGKADINPRQTLKEMQNGVYNDMLSPHALDTVMTGMKNQIEAEDKQQASQYRADVVAKMDSHFQSLMDTNTPVLTLNDVKLTHDEHLIKEFQFQDKVGREAYRVLKGKEGLPLDQQLSLLDHLQPKAGSANYAEESKAYEMLKTAVVNQNKEYQEDKVAASIKNNAQVAQAFNKSNTDGIRATITYQLGKGTPLNRIQVASNAQTSADADTLNSLLENQQFDQAKHYMNQLHDQYHVATLPDGRTAWDLYKNQLANNKSGKVSNEFLLAMQYQDIPEGNEIFQAYKPSMQDYTSILGDQKIKDINIAVSSAYAPYSSVISKIPGFAGSEQLASEKGLLTKYTARLVQQGIPVNEAAKQAFKKMYQYNIINNDKQKLILPDKINGTKINSATILQKISQLDNLERIYTHLSTGSNSTTLAKLSMKGHLHGEDLFLQQPAAQSIENINSSMTSILGHGIQVNDAYRSHEEQTRLYANRASNPYPVAKPGNSKHEKGISIDVQNHKEAATYLLSNGWIQPVKGDPVHFEYIGNGYDSPVNLPERLSTPDKRRFYADSVSKNGVWITSADLRSVSKYSKNSDGSLTPVYNGNHQPYSFTLLELQNGKLPAEPIAHVTPKKKQTATVGQVRNDIALKARKTAQQLSGNPNVTDAETNFILERGF